MTGQRVVQLMGVISVVFAFVLVAHASTASASAAADRLRRAGVQVDSGSNSVISSPTSAKANNSYDYFLFVVAWPVATCVGHSGSCGPINDWFIIHGLWPERNDGSYPSSCANTPIDMNQLEPLVDDMNKYWTNLFDTTDDFWSHEWSKHGTCATDVFDSQLDFFFAVLSLRANYTITPMPTDTPQSLSYYSSWVSKELGVTPVLNCVTSGKSQEILGFEICVNKSTLLPFSCNSAALAGSNCKNTPTILASSSSSSSPVLVVSS